MAAYERPLPMLMREIPKYETLLEMSHQYPELNPRVMECYLTLRYLASDVDAALTRHLARHDLSHGRFMVMLMIDQAADGRTTPGELAQQIDVTPATMTGLLRGLERDALIERGPHAADRRVVTIRLTDAGRTQLRGMLPDHFRRIARLMGHLSPPECGELTRLLRKVLAGVASLADPSPPASAREKE